MNSGQYSRGMSCLGFAAFLTISLSLGAVAAQQSVTRAKDQPSPNQTINVNTRLVQVMAIVRDKHGAVDGLTQSDFTLLDNGKPRQISVFSVAKASDKATRTQLAPGTFTNKLNQAIDSPVVATVILFDSLNTQFIDQAAARREAVKFLQAIDPQNPVAIYALGNNLRVLHDFTDDHVRLMHALERYRGENSRLLNNSEEPLEDFATQLIEPFQQYSIGRRSAITLTSLRAIADRMAGVPGRKNLIWISSAFPSALAFDRGGLISAGQNSVTYTGSIKDAATALDRANVAVYPVNAGSAGNGRFSMLDRQVASRPGTRSVPKQVLGSSEIETMQLLAEWTGGKAYLYSGDIRGAIRQAMDDAEIAYTLGFYVDSKELDGRYHELKVKTLRKGVEVRYRQGYFATAPSALGSQSLADTVVKAAFAPVDATGIGLTASLTPLPADPTTFTLAFTIDLQNVVLEEKDGKWTGGLTFLPLEQNEYGKVTDSAPKNISINITDDNRKVLLKDGLTFRLTVKPSAGSQIRLAVVDQLSGNVGSLRLRPPAKP